MSLPDGQLKFICEADTALALVGVEVETTGRLLSRITIKVAVALLFSASRATTEITLLPACKLSPVIDQFVVLATVLLAVPVAIVKLFTQVTKETAKLSAAVPDKLIGEVEAL